MNNNEETIAILKQIRNILLSVGLMIAVKFFFFPNFSYFEPLSGNSTETIDWDEEATE